MLFLLARDRNVVFIFVTSNPQEERAGWHEAQEARVSFEWGAWHAAQLMPSCTPVGVRSSPLPAFPYASGE